MNRDLRSIETIFQALSDATRLRIVGLLLSGEVCVCHIHETLKIPQSKASRHLAYLRRSGLVKAEKRGLWVYYSLATPAADASGVLVNAVRHCLAHLTIVKADGTRLEKKTGCSAPAPGAWTLSCCGVDGAAHSRMTPLPH